MKSESSKDNDPRRRRRWLKRLGLALALIVALLIAGLLVAARMAEPWLRQQAVQLVAQRADSELRLGELDIAWWPLALVAEDVSLTLDGEPEPYAAVQRLAAQVSWRELLNGRVRIDQVFADRPLLSIHVREDGTLALPRFDGDGGGGGRFELQSVELRDGEVRWRDGRVPVEATLSGLRGDSSAAGGRSSATLHADELSLLFDGHRLDFVVDGRVDWEQAQLVLIEVHGRRDLVDFDLSGSFVEGEGRFDVGVDGDLALLGPWIGGPAEEAGSAPSELMGRATLAARLTNTDDQGDDAPGGWRVSGDGRVEDLHYADLRIAEVPLSFEIVDGGVHVESEGLRAYGGDWRADLDLDGGEARLQLEGGGASLERMAADLGWDALAAGGRVGGKLDYGFAADHWRQGRGTAEVRVAAGGAWALSGTVPVEIGPELNLGLAGTLADARSQVELNGAFDALDQTGVIEFEVQSEQIVDLQRQIGVSGDYLPTGGAGRLRGRLQLTNSPASPILDIEADLRQLALASLAADTATASLRLDGRGVELERAELALAAVGEPTPGREGSRLVASGVFPSDLRPLRINAEATAWPVNQLLPLADLDFPVGGLATGTVDLQVDPRRPEGSTAEGSLQVTLDQPSWSGSELGGSVEAPIRIHGAGVEVIDGVWTHHEQQIAFDFVTQAGAEWTARVRGDDLDVARWRPELEILGEGYRASLEATLRGAESIRSADVYLATAADANGESQVLAGEINDGQVDLSGGLAGIASEVSVRGEISDAGPAFRAAGTVRLADWMEVQDVAVDGSLRVELEASGSWEQPVVTAGGTEVDLLVAGQTLRQLEPVRAVLEGNVLRLESAYLVNPRTGGEIFAAGNADLDSSTLDGVVQADLDALWLGSAVVELESTGSLSFLGTVEGTFDRPVLDGQGEWSDGTAQVEGFPHTLREISLRFLTGSGGVIVDRASAELSGGTLNATGNIDLDPERGLSYSSRVVARGISVNVPEDWWIGGDATLRISGNAESRLVSGDVSVERAVLLESVDLNVEQIMRAAFQRQREWVPSTDPLLRSTRLQLQVSGDDALRVGGEGLDLGGDIDLSIAGDLASPLLLGRVDLSTGGRIIFRSNTFEIERGVLLFSNPHVIDPNIDLVAVSQVRSYDVRLHLQGTLEAMEIKFTSDPALPSLEVVSLLTTGQVGRQPLLLEPISPTESTAAEGLIAGQAAEVIGSRVGRLFGLDRVQVDPLTESSGSLSSARITVAKRLSDDVVATYSYDPTDSEEQVVQLDWQLTPTVAMVLTQNGDGSYAVDFKWQQSF